MVNKSIFLSLLVIGVVAAAAGAGTWAQYLDTEVAPDNTVTAGTMDLQFGTAYTIPISVDNVLPGETVKVGTIRLKNIGDAKGKLYANVTGIIDYENIRIEPEVEAGDTTGATTGTSTQPGLGELSNVLRLKINDSDTNYAFKSINSMSTYKFIEEMDAGSLVDVDVYCDIPASATSAIQTDSVEFDINFKLVQVV